MIKEKEVRAGDTCVALYRLTNSRGMTVKVTNCGASLAYADAPDRNGTYEPVVLGFDSPARYLQKHPKFGCTVGRFANRIGHACFELGGKVYQLERNNGEHCIHGGSKGFHTRVFDTDPFTR